MSNQNLKQVPEFCKVVITKAGKCMVGFDSFADAEKFADANGLEVVLIQRRFGQDIWSNMGRIFNEPSLTADDFDGFIGYYSPSDVDLVMDELNMDWLTEESMEELGEEGVACVVKKMNKLADAVRGLKEGEMVVRYEGEIDNFVVLPKHPMKWDNDVDQYQIAVSLD